MGVSFKGLIEQKNYIELEDLRGKILAVDAFNMLYQFITTIRQQDGSPLKNAKGEVTSHMVGLFSRVTHLMRYGIRPIFVFDGEAPELKKKEQKRRASLKKDAQLKYDEAMEKQDLKSMKKYAGRTSRLTAAMVDDAKTLLEALGLPWIDAPSEGDAQAAHIVKRGDAYATVSQDFDTLMHGSPLLVKNLSIAGRRKRTGTLSYDTIKPELIRLAEILNSLGIDRDRLIALGMLIGTDYNIGGIKGIGPKTALKKVKEYKDDFDGLFKEVGWDDSFDIPWKEVFDTIKRMPVKDDYRIGFKDIDPDGVKSLLTTRFDFSAERVDSTLSKLLKDRKTREQRGLGDFF